MPGPTKSKEQLVSNETSLCMTSGIKFITYITPPMSTSFQCER